MSYLAAFALAGIQASLPEFENGSQVEAENYRFVHCEYAPIAIPED